MTLKFYPIKKQHFIQGQNTRPKKGNPRGEEAEVTRSSLLLVRGFRHRPEKYVGSNLQLACRGPEKPAEGREQASSPPMPGPGLDIKIKKASSDRER